ncbi:T9SS type A sorting domain-containing protein [Odoribacter sp. OttesenSCG-928-L07]|nr:T9SS type A sorting domain-containing protein [Odoribacter sp. OttesenSCG-928-L07]MDL2238606.1 T9SS type A sorting domain-containing protein [Bacteroidales bacterium OttesenSCG-928-L14]MDL2240516.1 T9SS type A sorting domain-containing protein [Bacteroidales bacterium OttesenSCG-928-K22]
MKKTILLLSVFILSIVSLNAQENVRAGQIHDLGSELFIMDVSSNGEYVVGYQMGGAYSVLWTESGGSQNIYSEGGCMAFAVANNGVFAGQFFDPNITYFDWEGNELPLLTAGYYQDGQWVSLGIRPELDPVEEMNGSMVDGISDDGTIMAGAMYSQNWQIYPTVWTNGVYEELECEMIGQGGRVQALSGDGSVAAGWVAPYNTRIPAVWVNGELRIMTINGMIHVGECLGVSSNGRYVGMCINNLGAIYDVQEDKLNIIGKGKNAFSASVNDVSDDGIAIGYNQMGMLFDREAFIYHERMGMVNLKEYLISLGVEGAEYAGIECPIAISADGTRIVGFGSSFNGFVIDVEHNISGYYSPKDLSVIETSFREMKLEWTAANNDPENTLSGYNIYCNGNKVNPTIITTTSYTDNITEDGIYNYYVAAVWNEVNESAPTNNVKVCSGILPLPFFEEFNSMDFVTNLWTIQPMAEERWLMFDYVGIVPPAVSYATVSGTYSESLTSAFIDATEAEELFLSFNLSIPTASNDNTKDLFKLEIFDGNEWNTIEEFYPLINEWGAFVPKQYDITNIAAGKTIRIRFTAIGNNSEGENMYWSVDNINVFSPENAFTLEVPRRVTAHKSDDGTVHVNWADPGRLATLSYLESDYLVDGIGNEGVPFMVANKFEANDLKGYDGYYLESISAYLTGAVSSPSTFKLAVFLGKERIVDQDIDNYTQYEWNTFNLLEPILITKEIDQDLYFGIEVVSHQEGDLPLGVCDRPMLDWENMLYSYEGRSNIYSEDGGQTWGTLSEFDLFYSCGLKAHLIGAENPQAKERLMGYIVYREGESLLGMDWLGNKNLTALNNFTDTTSNVNEKACYQVTAYYTVQQESESTQFCLGDEIGGITTVNTENQYVVYPNPTSDIINIKGNFTNATLYSADGRILMKTSESLINLNKYPRGVYFIKINSENNTSETQKIIKY